MLETIQYIGKYYRQSNTFQYIRKGSNIYGIHKTQSNIVSGIFYFYLLSITSFKTIKIENVGRVLKNSGKLNKMDTRIIENLYPTLKSNLFSG